MKEPHALEQSSHSTEMDCAFFTVDAGRALLFLHKVHIPRGAILQRRPGDWRFTGAPAVGTHAASLVNAPSTHMTAG